MSNALDFAEMIGTWPAEGKRRSSIRAFSEDTGIAYDHACMMKQRNSIPPEHWPAVVRAARVRGLTYTNDVLVEITRRVKAQRRKRGKRKASESRVAA